VAGRYNPASLINAAIAPKPAATYAMARTRRRFAGSWGNAARLVVIGGGVIGLEVDAVARSQGRLMEVVETAPRVLGRGVRACGRARTAVERPFGQFVRT